MGEQPGLLILRPEELLFSNVRLGQVLPPDHLAQAEWEHMSLRACQIEWTML